ncbi:hypothetical protein Bca4012_042857 [Brassica carinata]
MQLLQFNLAQGRFIGSRTGSAWSRDGKCGWASCGQRTCVQGRPGQESFVVEKCGWVKCGWVNRGQVKNVSGMRRADTLDCM